VSSLRGWALGAVFREVSLKEGGGIILPPAILLLFINKGVLNYYFLYQFKGIILKIFFAASGKCNFFPVCYTA